MVGRLEGKTAIVTGAGRGIGNGVASLFAGEGAHVLIVDNGSFVDGRGVNAEIAEHAANAIRERGGDAEGYCGDVSDTGEARKMVETALDRWRRLDIVVNVAGNFRLNTIADVVDEDWDAVIRVHLRGTMAVTRAAVAHWLEHDVPGRIINFASLAGQVGLPSMLAYSAAKGGILGFTRACANELAHRRITANCICPLAHTRMLDRGARSREDVEHFARTGQWPEHPELAAASLSDSGAAGAAVNNEPASVAPLVVYLASDAAANVSGRSFTAGGNHFALWNEPEEVRHIYEDGKWDLDRLFEVFPQTLGAGLQLPGPPWALPTLDLPKESEFPHELLG